MEFDHSFYGWIFLMIAVVVILRYTLGVKFFSSMREYAVGKFVTPPLAFEELPQFTPEETFDVIRNVESDRPEYDALSILTGKLPGCGACMIKYYIRNTQRAVTERVEVTLAGRKSVAFSFKDTRLLGFERQEEPFEEVVGRRDSYFVMEFFKALLHHLSAYDYALGEKALAG